jgi:proline iminopeptidase
MKTKIIYLFLITILLVQCNDFQKNTDIRLSSSEGYISLNDSIELYYKLIGSGADTIVFLHGGPGLPSYYLMADLKPLAFNHTLLFYDQRGCGKSTPIKDTLLLDASNYVSDLEAIRQHFGISKMNIVGHSWGGLLAGLYASSYPEFVKKMVLIASCPPAMKYEWDDFSPNLYAKFDSLEMGEVNRTWDDRFAREDYIKACWDHWTIFIKAYYSNPILTRNMWGDVCNCPSSTIDFNNHHWFIPMASLGEWDFSEKMKNFNFPVFIMHGIDDPMPLGCAQAWEDLLPDAQLSVFKDAGHFPQVEKPELFFSQFNQFFKGVWPVDTSSTTIETIKQIPDEVWGINRAFTEIKLANKEFMDGISSLDASALLKLYTNDAIVMAPTAPLIQGHLTIEAFWQSAMDKGLSKAELLTMDLEGNDDQLSEIGKYILYDKDKNVLDIGKYLIIWKYENGKWLMSKDMFNTNMKKPSSLYEWESKYLF